MNRILRSWIPFVVGAVLSLAALSGPAWAASVDNGAKLFTSNCAACHVGGGNLVNGSKTLSKADLEKYGMASEEAIATQITKGKMAMPAFGGRLTPQEIEDVTAYVLAQAEKGW